MLIHTRWFDAHIGYCATATFVVAYELDGRDLYVRLWVLQVVLSWLP